MGLDRSKVPPQGAYLARSCPVVCQWDVLQPTEPAPVSAFRESLSDQGDDHEEDIFDVILKHHPDAVHVEEDEARTVEAIEAGVAVILAARLPIDEAGRRVGKPDILVAAPGGGYRAVDVKSHKVLASNDKAPALVSTPAALAYESASPLEGQGQKIKEPDRHQLAHYQRILEAHGWAAKDGPIAAVLGSEGLCAWINLDEVEKRTPAKTQKTKMRSAMERYDFEFAWRLDIIATAQRHQDDPSVPLLVEPWACSDCPECRWRDHCLPILEERRDISLLPDVKTDRRLAYGKAGIETFEDLAALDPKTASLVADQVVVTDLLEIAESYPDDVSIGDDKTIKRRHSQLRKLNEAGIFTFGQARDQLCPRTASIATGETARLIDEARSALGESPAYRRRGVDSVEIPRADVEIDIDMENVPKPPTTYLWGALVQGHPDASVNRYHPFARFDEPTEELDATVSGEFWTWLKEMIGDCQDRGLTLKIYCYHSPAESTALGRFASATGLQDEINELIASDTWVDMKEIFKDHFVTGTGVGLKMIAQLAGYKWAANDPGGAESILRFDAAVRAEDAADRESAIEWLLTYNRGDAEATAHLRDWLSREADNIPRIEELDQRFQKSGSARRSERST